MVSGLWYNMWFSFIGKTVERSCCVHYRLSHILQINLIRHQIKMSFCHSWVTGFIMAWRVWNDISSAAIKLLASGTETLKSKKIEDFSRGSF